MKTFFTTFLFLAACAIASAQTSVSHNPAFMQSQPAMPPPGGTSWVSPNNIATNDNVSAYATMSSYGMCMGPNCYHTETLRAAGFGFNIPLTATITGIEAQVSRYASVTTYVQDMEVKLTLNGVATGTNYANPTAWATTSAYATYGGSTDLWNAVLTPTDVNTSGFGVSFKAYNYMNNVATAYVDHIFMKVYYVEACTGLTLTATGLSNETAPGANNGHATLTMGGTAPYTFKSYVGGNMITSGNITASPHTAAGLAGANYKYVLTDAGNCKDSVTFVINTTPATNTVIVEPTTALKSYDASAGFNVYPNPSYSDLTIELESPSLPAALSIYDITGKEVFSGILNEKKQVINTLPLPKGVYSIKITDQITVYRSRFIRG